jgi:hypothetical protein
MMPPELLHTSGSGLIMYMFESLREHMGGGKDSNLIDRQHILISNLIKKQSERDFPRGSMRNGLLMEKKSVFRIKGKFVSTTVYCTYNNWKLFMKTSIKYSDAKWKQYIKFLKQYLCSMEEWFHNSNNKVEVINARPLIAKVL